MKHIIKNPEDEDLLDYLWKWGDWLSEGDIIDDVNITVPSGINLVGSPTVVNDGKDVLMWLTGGTSGIIYIISCQINTIDGRTKTRRLRIEIKEH